MKKINYVKKTMLIFAVSLFVAGCSKETEAPKEVAMQPDLKAINCCLISTTNDVNDMVECYDQNATSWTSTKWSWKPTTTRGFIQDTEIYLWGGPTDVKLRNNSYFGGQVAAICSGRFSTIVDYPSGNKRWFQGHGEGSSLHGIELLPNGNIVVASAGGINESAPWIRMYTPLNPGYRFERWMNSAHGLLWDPNYNCLWVIGGYLYKMVLEGTTTEPTLRITETHTLPTQWGHDIAPCTGDNNKMWISTNGGVYKFDKTNSTFTVAPGASNRTFVKGISSLSNGYIVQTKVDPACTFNGWCTDHVDFYNASGVFQYKRTRTGTAWYKGKVFNSSYYMATE